MRKYILTMLAIVGSALMLVSCNKGTPKDVAQEWLTAFYHQDYEVAKKISTEETKAMLSTIQGFTGSLPDSVKQKAKKVVISIKDVKEEGDKATVRFMASDDTNEPPALKLVKQNDKWLVQFSKSDFIGNEEGQEGDATLSTETPSADSATISVAPAAAPADSSKKQ